MMLTFDSKSMRFRWMTALEQGGGVTKLGVARSGVQISDEPNSVAMHYACMHPQLPCWVISCYTISDTFQGSQGSWNQILYVKNMTLYSFFFFKHWPAWWCPWHIYTSHQGSKRVSFETKILCLMFLAKLLQWKNIDQHSRSADLFVSISSEHVAVVHGYSSHVLYYRFSQWRHMFSIKPQNSPFQPHLHLNIPCSLPSTNRLVATFLFYIMFCLSVCSTLFVIF